MLTGGPRFGLRLPVAGSPSQGHPKVHSTLRHVVVHYTNIVGSYLDEILNENQRLRKGDGNFRRGETTRNPAPTPGPPAADSGEAARNPLLEERPWFAPMTALEMPIHIGEAADAAFATRFRQALSDVPVDHIPRTDYAMDKDLLMLSEADCTWPSPARAKFLLETSLLSICQCYHIIRKSAVRRDLDLTPRSESSHDNLTTCRLWALFALGELYSTRVPSHGHRFPGLAYFAQASRLLRFLSERPRIGYMEVLLLLVGYGFAPFCVLYLRICSPFTRSI